MAVDPETIKQLATHDADIRYLRQDTDQIVRSMSVMQEDLRAIKETLAEARGGWRVLLLIGGAGGALGSAITAWINNVLHLPR